MHRRRTSSSGRTAMDWNNISCQNFRTADKCLQRLLFDTFASEIRLTYGGREGTLLESHAWNLSGEVRGNWGSNRNFPIISGVSQGCVLSPRIFSAVRICLRGWPTCVAGSPFCRQHPIIANFICWKCFVQIAGEQTGCGTKILVAMEVRKKMFAACLGEVRR